MHSVWVVGRCPLDCWFLHAFVLVGTGMGVTLWSAMLTAMLFIPS